MDLRAFATHSEPSQPGQQDTEEKKTRLFFAGLFAFAVGILWIAPLRSSFWLDETGTFWIIKDGLANLLKRSEYWSGVSPLYYLTAWLAFAAGGREEWILRLPSLAAMAVAAWLFYRLAKRLFDSATARIAVLCFACFEPVAYAASDARPYALALALLIGSVLMLVRWLDNGRARYLAGYILLAALTVYAHYLFAPSLAVPGLYAVSRLIRERRAALWKLAAAWAAGAVLLLPLVPQLRRSYQSSGVHVFADTPAFGDLLRAFVPPVLAGSIVVGLFLVWLIGPTARKEPAVGRDGLHLAIGWALLPPVLLFAVSVVSPAKLFVPRYYLAYAPGLCLTAAWAVREAADRRGQRIVAAVLAVFTVLSYGTAQHGNEDWSGAMRRVRAENRGGSLPVLAASGFVEATDPRMLDDPKLRDVLFAPQAMYPAGGRIVRLPYRLNDESIRYLENVIPTVEHEQRFILVVRFAGFTFEPWLRGRLAPLGFQRVSLGDFGDVGVFLFSRQANGL